MKATVDQDTCTGCGLCPDICPEVFEMDDAGLARVKVDEVPPGQDAAAREAADSCPVQAITIEE